MSAPRPRATVAPRLKAAASPRLVGVLVMKSPQFFKTPTSYRALRARGGGTPSITVALDSCSLKAGITTTRWRPKTGS